ncbi:sensor histidine kinase [Dyella choica]|uniref:histidine kinase n=1 Tax=Dyella choica TaxID=1927959 RepID=A0A432M3V4_9GAMM|nr:ATP-binding protein [Dyella choica]RUL73661.1 HAMP domain-containing histidine kinase [Dyella choica]
MKWALPRRGKSMPLLWWLGLRMSALAAGAVVVIAFSMWLRYVIWDAMMLRALPPDARQQMQQWLASPRGHEQQLWRLLARYYDVVDFLPGLTNRDWLVLAALVLGSVPVIVLFGLIYSRPLSRQFSHVVGAAHRVADGDFSARASLVQGAPGELSRLAVDFNSMTAKLQQYEREIRESSAMLAHELRTPLNAAMGRVQGMLEDVFPRDAEQLVLIQRQLEQINRLVGDLHFLSMERAGQLPLEREDFSLADLVQERLTWASLQLKDAGMAVTCHVPADTRINADRDRIGQALSILIDNAVRYAASGRQLHIEVMQSAAGTSIAVTDHGPGVSDEHLARMQDRFWRADHSRARHLGGSGLGLAIASAICQSHGGALEMTRGSERGIRARIRFPVSG